MTSVQQTTKIPTFAVFGDDLRVLQGVKKEDDFGCHWNPISDKCFLVNGKQLIWIEPDQLHGLMDDQNHGLLSKARNITFTLQMYIPTDDGQQH